MAKKGFAPIGEDLDQAANELERTLSYSQENTKISGSQVKKIKKFIGKMKKPKDGRGHYKSKIFKFF